MKSFTKKSLSILALSLTGTVAFGSLRRLQRRRRRQQQRAPTRARPTRPGPTPPAPIADAGKSDTGTGDAAGDAAPVDAGPQYIRTGTVSLTQTQNFSRRPPTQTTATATFSQRSRGHHRARSLPSHHHRAGHDLHAARATRRFRLPVDAGADAAVADARHHRRFRQPRASRSLNTDSKTPFPASRRADATAATERTAADSRSTRAQTKYFAAAAIAIALHRGRRPRYGRRLHHHGRGPGGPHGVPLPRRATALTGAFPAIPRGVDPARQSGLGCRARAAPSPSWSAVLAEAGDVAALVQDARPARSPALATRARCDDPGRRLSSAASD